MHAHRRLRGGSTSAATVVDGRRLGGFAGARWLRSLAYLGAKQPWRTSFFALGGLGRSRC
jgi:hypothetical protein